MSITFNCPMAPRVITASYDCCDHADCPHCQGYGKVVFFEPKGSVNVSNANAFLLLEALGMQPEYGGKIELADVPDFRRRIVKVLQSPGNHAVAPTAGTGAGGCQFYDMGASSQYITQRMQQLDELARIAQECEGPIYWG